MIGEEPPKTSDPEVAAKRAIDEAVATLRSLAEGVQARPARPEFESRAERFAPGERAPSGEAFPARPPLGDRLRNGFHRLGLVLALALLAVNGVMLLAFFDPSENLLDIKRTLLLLLAAAALYLLCRSMAWVALGFVGEPRPGDGTALRAAGAETVSPQRIGPRGIGGWLWFPIIAAAVAVISNVVTLSSLAADFPEAMSRSFEARASFLLGLAAINIGLLIGWLYALVLMLRRRRRFPRVYVVLSLWSLALVTATGLTATFYFDFLDRAWLLASIAGEVARAIWMPYMLRSRRVRNTFVN